MDSGRWVHVARLGELKNGYGTRRVAEDEDLALWRLGGDVFGLRNHCAHQHAATMHEASRAGKIITCPLHGWSFRLDDGWEENGRGRLRTYETKVEDEEVFVFFPAGPAWQSDE